jgi:hypothetical protein
MSEGMSGHSLHASDGKPNERAGRHIGPILYLPGPISSFQEPDRGYGKLGIAKHDSRPCLYPTNRDSDYNHYSAKGFNCIAETRDRKNHSEMNNDLNRSDAFSRVFLSQRICTVYCTPKIRLALCKIFS